MTKVVINPRFFKPASICISFLIVLMYPVFAQPIKKIFPGADEKNTFPFGVLFLDKQYQ